MFIQTETSPLQIGAHMLDMNSEAKTKIHAIQQPHADVNNVFASPHWFDNGSESNLLSFIENDNAIHVKPHNIFGIKFAELAGEPYIQYNDMSKNGDQPTAIFLDNFVKYLKSNAVNAVHLHNVRADAHIFKYCQANGIILQQKTAPFLNLTNYDDFDGYLKSLSKQTRYNYNKSFRTHDCQYDVYVDDEISHEIVEQVIAQKTAQLKLRGETSRLFANATKLNGLIDKLTTPNTDYKTYVTTFKMDGIMVSSTVFFIKNGKVYFYILAMDDNFAKLSPGNNIVLKNIQTAFTQNCELFDFLAPNDVYKLKWSRGDAVPVFDILLPITIKGRIIGSTYLKTIRPFLKKIYLSVKNNVISKTLARLMK